MLVKNVSAEKFGLSKKLQIKKFSSKKTGKDIDDDEDDAVFTNKLKVG